MGKKDSSKDTKRCSKRVSRVSLLKPKAPVVGQENQFFVADLRARSMLVTDVVDAIYRCQLRDIGDRHRHKNLSLTSM